MNDMTVPTPEAVAEIIAQTRADSRLPEVFRNLPDATFAEVVSMVLKENAENPGLQEDVEYALKHMPGRG